MKILVTGPSGFVGSHLLPALLGRGHTVRALVRSDGARDRVTARTPEADGSSLEFVTGDVTKSDTLPPAANGVDAAVHLVAIARDWNGGRDLERINTTGTLNVLDAMRVTGVRRLVHQGAMGVTEDRRLHYSTSKARAEAAVRASDLDWTVLKPSLLWGERDGFFNLIADLARMTPVVPIPARQRSRYQPFAVSDWARVASDVLERPDTIRRSYDLGGPRYWTYREIVAEVIRGAGKRRLIAPVPLPLIKLVARGSETVRLPFPVASDQLRQLAHDNIGPLDAVRRDFGFDPLPMEGNLGYLRRRLRDQEPSFAGAPKATRAA